MELVKYLASAVVGCFTAGITFVLLIDGRVKAAAPYAVADALREQNLATKEQISALEADIKKGKAIDVWFSNTYDTNEPVKEYTLGAHRFCAISWMAEIGEQSCACFVSREIADSPWKITLRSKQGMTGKCGCQAACIKE